MTLSQNRLVHIFDWPDKNDEALEQMHFLKIYIFQEILFHGFVWEGGKMMLC